MQTSLITHNRVCNLYAITLSGKTRRSYFSGNTSKSKTIPKPNPVASSLWGNLNIQDYISTMTWCERRYLCV